MRTPARFLPCIALVVAAQIAAGQAPESRLLDRLKSAPRATSMSR